MMNFLQNLFKPNIKKPNIEELESRRNVRGLIRALNHKDWFIRRNAANSLGRLKDARAIKPLITALQHGDSTVRREAAKALGQLGDARAVDPLITVLKDSEIWVREAAARALEQIGWRPTKNEAGARYWIVKEEWDKGIEIGAPAIEPLITALQDGRYSTVREAAAAALEQLGWRPDKNETGARYWIVKRIWNKCVEIGAPAVAPLITALQDSNGWVRNGAAKALVDIYQADRVGEASKRRILELREIIITSHQDHTLHSDWDSLSESSDCQHSDISHKDVGIGVYFPI